MIATQLPLDSPTLAGPPAELCVNCEGEAAGNWLLCLPCVAIIDETMLIRLTKKYKQLGDWLAKADDVLSDMPRDDPDFFGRWSLWSAKLRVYQRLAWLGRAVKAAV